MKKNYQSAAERSQLPAEIVGEGLLVGWSTSQRPFKRPMGFAFGDAVSSEDARLVDPILFDGEGHLLTVAATGAGKGIGCIVPALLRHKGPMIVIDPKGENAAITKRYREEVLGQKVFVIDPMDVVEGPSARLNPLDAIDPAERTCVDEAAALADLLSSHLKGDTHNRFWHNRAIHLITALMLDAASSSSPQDRCLAAVRDKLSRGAADNGKALVKMLLNSPHPAARRAAAAFDSSAADTIGSMIATAHDLVDFVRGEPVREATSASDFDLDAITRGEPITVYIVLPPHMLESHAQLLRLWVGALLKAIMRRNFRPPKPTLLVLDEAAQLGNFAPLRQAITLLRGYGLQTWSFWQDVEQLKHSYPDSWRTLINNCRVVQAFGAPNMSAAASIAELFLLYNPGRILDLDEDEMIVQIAGDDAFLARRPDYLSDPAFAGKFDANPLYSDVPPPVTDPKPVKHKPDTYLRDDQPSTEDEIIRSLLERFKEDET